MIYELEYAHVLLLACALQLMACHTSHNLIHHKRIIFFPVETKKTRLHSFPRPHLAAHFPWKGENVREFVRPGLILHLVFYFYSPVSSNIISRSQSQLNNGPNPKVSISAIAIPKAKKKN